MADKATPANDAMTDLKTLRQLVKLMADNDLTELDLKDADHEVHLKRGHAAPPVVQAVAAPAVGLPAPVAAAPGPESNTPGGPSEGGAGGPTIDSPMVGTFFAAPNPDAAPFVAVGDTVNNETVVCLVEAMKVFNEIKAEASGVVAKVLVENGQAVEFGQPLFELRD